MTCPALLLAEVHRLGATLRVANGRLHLSAPAPLPDSVVETLRRKRTGLLRLLSMGETGKSAPGELLPMSVSESLRQLRPDQRRGDFGPARWATIVADANRLAVPWAARALALGWTVVDLFGAHPRCPSARVDAAGLAVMMSGRALLALDTDTATLRAPSGSHLRYYRKPHREAVPIWALPCGSRWEAG